MKCPPEAGSEPAFKNASLKQQSQHFYPNDLANLQILNNYIYEPIVMERAIHSLEPCLTIWFVWKIFVNFITIPEKS